MRILKIGILPYEKQKERLFAIAKGEYVPSKDEPRVWFSSLESLSQVLDKNRMLLEMIAYSKPTSIAELAVLSQRKESNLSRTLKTMARYGLVRLDVEGRRKRPVFPYDGVSIDYNVLSTAL